MKGPVSPRFARLRELLDRRLEEGAARAAELRPRLRLLQAVKAADHALA